MKGMHLQLIYVALEQLAAINIGDSTGIGFDHRAQRIAGVGEPLFIRVGQYQYKLLRRIGRHFIERVIDGRVQGKRRWQAAQIGIYLQAAAVDCPKTIQRHQC